MAEFARRQLTTRIKFCSVPLGDNLNMIGLRQHKLSRSLRICAAALVVVWLAAIGLCSTDCMGDDCHADTAHIKKAATTNGQSHDSDSHDDSLCVSLHSVCPATPSATFIKPDFGLVLTLDFISSRQIVAVTPPETFISRQPPDRGWVFTPEVCLGAAFRSLAPPRSSLS
ncbi:MAG TPA: hypothetical protein VIK53_15950 [Verrucomicrobiae bacterium]